MKDTETRLFGTSGIRGLVNKEIDSEFSLKVGRAISSLFPRSTVTIGRDTRLSGDMLTSSLIAGLLSGGCRVLELGVLPTPALAYLTTALSAACGIMITASHNPAEFNGIKLFGSDGSACGELVQKRIEEVIAQGLFRGEEWNNLGESSPIDETSKYVSMVADGVELNRSWRIALDPCNGAASQLGPRVMKELGCTVFSANAQPDATFLGRNPEPSSTSLDFLSKVVLAHECEIGIAYDGDADRVAIADERGRYITQDVALAAFTKHISSRLGGGTFALPIDTSLTVKESVEKHGGKIVWTRVGDVYVSDAIKEHKAVFGGEPSGAWIHPAFHLCPDGILSGALLLKAIEDTDSTASEFFVETGGYHMRRGKIECHNNLKVEVVEKTSSRLQNLIAQEFDVARSDGFRLSLEDAWILIRASGTEPAIRVTVEAKTSERLDRLFDTAMQACRDSVAEVTT